MKANRKGNATQRRGVAAVEFAIVAPVVFFLIFTIFELARLILFSGSVNTALLTGARHLTLQDATATEVDETIRAELRKFGITAAQIRFTPSDFVASTPEVQIDVDVPVSSTFAVQLTEISRRISITRESQ